MVATRGKNTPSIKNAIDLIFVESKSYNDLDVYEINNQWCEIDTVKDYQLAQKFYSKNIDNNHGK